MPNPNFSELALWGRYGPDEDHLQSTKIYSAVSEDSDETDHKYVEEVLFGGRYVELAHYASVKQIVIQNDAPVWSGITFHADATTGALVPVTLEAEEHTSINNVDTAAGLMLFAEEWDGVVDWHLVIVGRLA